VKDRAEVDRVTLLGPLNDWSNCLEVLIFET